jgi:uncharacterized protein (DUF488 family)
MDIYTIGFTKKSAEKFFSLLKNNKIDALFDIRLNNTSQLAGFTKYPDIEFFLKHICNIKYIHDIKLAPTDKILHDYKKNVITWDDYVNLFDQLMERRCINEYLVSKYADLFKNNRVCLLCSESTPERCHRSLVAARVSNAFDSKIVNL